jgi:hypothetical protein
VSDLALYKYLPRLSEEALKEFAEWCILEHAKVAEIEFTPDATKLANLIPNEYIWELIDQFLKVKPDPIRAGLVLPIAGKEADDHGLTGSAIMVDFISLYIKYLIPKDGSTGEFADQLLAEASKAQYDKLMEIAKKHGIDL